MIWNFVLRAFIFLIHIGVVLFILFMPYVNNVCLLFLYVVISSGILVHWIGNNDICILTEIEKKLNKTISAKEQDKYFLEQIISPIYTFPHMHEKLHYISYVILIFGLSLSLSKLIYRMQTEKLPWISLFII